jgi:hypothetical protein
MNNEGPRHIIKIFTAGKCAMQEYIPAKRKQNIWTATIGYPK